MPKIRRWLHDRNPELGRRVVHRPFPQSRLRFPELALVETQILPYTFEGFGLLMERGCMSVSDDGRIRTLPKKVRKTVDGTAETVACQKAARIVGREFARIADRATVYTTFGIRP